MLKNKETRDLRNRGHIFILLIYADGTMTLIYGDSDAGFVIGYENATTIGDSGSFLETVYELVDG